METSKYLRLARAARDEDNGEDAKKFYDMVRVEDPENGEAKFFYQYYSLYEGKNGELASRFVKLTNTITSAITMVAESTESASEKLSIIKAMAEAFTPMTWALNSYMNKLTVGSGSDRQRVLPTSDIHSSCVVGVVSLYNMGDTIAKLFPNNSDAMKLCVMVWKEGVSLQQKWYAYNYNGKTAEEYAQKIQKIDSSYEMPKKAGCISFSNKK